MKPFYKTVVFWVLIAEFLIAIILGLFGFKMTYAPSLENNWVAISATANWIAALAAVAIPVVVFYLQRVVERNKKDIGGANVDLLREIEALRNEVNEKLVHLDGQNRETPLTNLEPDVIREKQKEKALKFINISMIAHTQAVANELNMPKEDTYHLLIEMMRHDKSISCAGQNHIGNIDGVLWMRKSG